MNNSRVIKLFTNCIPVSGARRGAICDLQRQVVVLVPLSLINLFDENNTINLFAVTSKLTGIDKLTFNNYVTLLEQHDLIFSCTNKESSFFPKLSMDWDFPSQATNAIIDFDSNSDPKWLPKIINQLDCIQCYHIQFRSFNVLHIKIWEELIELITTSKLKSIHILSKDDRIGATRAAIGSLIQTSNKLIEVTLHSSDVNQTIISKSIERARISYKITEEIINGKHHCGIIAPHYFSPTIEAFTEAQRFNTCLNRKISVDTDGSIKNCPSMKETFGNIKGTTLLEVITQSDFRRHWLITKEQIIKCRDCEFRNICTDCRAYLENPKDLFSAPLKCGYNPYTCEWEEWSSNPLKKMSIEYYGMHDFMGTECK